MRKIKQIVAVLLFLGSVNQLLSWDTTAAKFYPLQIGNTWVYRWESFAHLSCTIDGVWFQKESIVSFELKPNGKWYYKLTGTVGTNYFRVDSSSMNVYVYNASPVMGECLVDSLLAKVNDTFMGCDAYSLIQDSLSIFYAGESRLTYRKNRASPNYLRLMWGIGKYFEYACAPDGYQKTLKGSVINGVLLGDTSSLVGFTEIVQELPEKYELLQNYPNPFNPTTQFGFQIADFGLVRLTVFDAIGREVEVLLNQQLQRGTYEVSWDASNYPSGVYYYRLEAGDFTETKKMLLVK